MTARCRGWHSVPCWLGKVATDPDGAAVAVLQRLNSVAEADDLADLYVAVQLVRSRRICHSPDAHSSRPPERSPAPASSAGTGQPTQRPLPGLAWATS